jgi:uncharacterized protein
MQAHASLSAEFLQLASDHHAQLILRVRSGSHAYGLANAQSDEDERGIFVIPSKHYARLQAMPNQLSDGKHDHVYYSLRRMFELLSESNPGMVEVLFTPIDCVLDSDPRLQMLWNGRSIFVTQTLVQALLAYANGQIKKARGQNKWINQPQPEKAPLAAQFCFFIPDPSVRGSALPARPKPIAELPVPLAHCHAARVEHGGHLYRLYHIGADARGVFRGDGLPVCESISIDVERQQFLGLLLFNEQGFQKAKLDHHNYWQWREQRNEARWLAQEQGMLDYDAKNMMHCMRLLYSAREITISGTPMVRVPDDMRAELLAVRAGQYCYEEVLERAQRVIETCEANLRTTSLAEAISKPAVDALYQELVDEFDRGLT